MSNNTLLFCSKNRRYKRKREQNTLTNLKNRDKFLWKKKKNDDQVVIKIWNDIHKLNVYMCINCNEILLLLLLLFFIKRFSFLVFVDLCFKMCINICDWLLICFFIFIIIFYLHGMFRVFWHMLSLFLYDLRGII